MTPIFGYLDANGVEAFSTPRPPIDHEMRSFFLCAIAEGRLIVPFSDSVAQEIVAVAMTDPKKAEQLGRFYGKIASFDHAVGPTGAALRQAISEALGDEGKSKFTNLSAAQRKAARLRLVGKAHDIRTIITDYKKATDEWVERTRGYRETVREFMASMPERVTPMPIAEAVAGVWPGMAGEWAWRLADGVRCGERAREAKATDEMLLAISGLRAAIGSSIGLAAAQTINARMPRQADYGDGAYCTLAACAGIPLVTSDDNLRKLVEAIPDNPLAVISPIELLERAGWERVT